MKLKIISGTLTTVVALCILSISFLRSVSIKYAYNPTALSEFIEKDVDLKIDYDLPFPGNIHPDNPIWYAKVIRDKLLLLFNFSESKRSGLNLRFADKRLGSALYLFENSKPDLGVATLSKAEKYLQRSYHDSIEDSQILKDLSLSSLKHRQLIENKILTQTPEELQPEVIKLLTYSKEIYTKTSEKLISKGEIPPENPFKTK